MYYGMETPRDGLDMNAQYGGFHLVYLQISKCGRRILCMNGVSLSYPHTYDVLHAAGFTRIFFS